MERTLNLLHRRAGYFVGWGNRIEIRAKVKTRIYFPFAEVMTFHKNLSLKTCHKKQGENAAISLDFLSIFADIGEHLDYTDIVKCFEQKCPARKKGEHESTEKAILSAELSSYLHIKLITSEESKREKLIKEIRRLPTLLNGV